MERRTFLRWAVHGLGAVVGAVIGVPAVFYVIDPRNRPAPERAYLPIAKLSELREGEPKEVVIRATRRDAWTLYPDEVVGRVWLVRRGNDAAGRPQLDVFTATCPHLGCSVNSTGNGFLCPCHGGRFNASGQKEGGSNPAPRDMDTLLWRADPIPETSDYTVLVQYQKFKTNQPAKEVDA